ncbi:MAG TPA: DNA repair protein RecN [Vicinamibacterales bacterium]|jgi:DNA repair protein RecN (Recombination protein N)
MLRFLDIRNLAVIEAVEIEFGEGLNVLTGETGAGKSILIEAVGLLLGERASPDLVRTGEDCATVQAVFDGEDGDDLIIRREVTTQGRSRAFVNGSLVTAAALRELGARLVDLHGQHEHQALLDPECHLDLLDRFGAVESQRRETEEAFARLQAARSTLNEARQQERQRASRLELIDFQLNELERIQPKPGEDDELSALRMLLSSAERVRRLADESYAILYDRDDAVLAGLGQVWRRVGELASLDARFAPYVESRDSIKSQLDDLATFLRGYAASIDTSPARLQEVEDRLATLERLKRKHGPTLSDAIATQTALRTERALLESIAERMPEIEKEVADATSQFSATASRLSSLRRPAAATFAHDLERQLADLAMEHTRFEVRFNPQPLAQDRWVSRGIDSAEFYVSPNPGEDLRPLTRIVSGGEMSRIMLGIKTLASLDQPGKSLVFDEVDAGIGGRVADAVGSKLQALGQAFQVLCITHLPQIAAYGTRHFRIQKEVRGGRTTTRVESLDAAGREDELARMIGGVAISSAARQSARELLRTRQVGTREAKGESADHAKGESETSQAKGRRR